MFKDRLAWISIYGRILSLIDQYVVVSIDVRREVPPWPQSARTVRQRNCPGSADKVGRYLRSPSTRLAAFAGLLTYLCYAYAHDSWTNPALIGVALFFAVFMPTYTKLSNKAELWANNRFGFVTAGRLGRFVPQFAFNLVVFAVMLWGGGMSRSGVATVGGIAGAALITSLASQGLQYLGTYLFARGIGDLNRNVLVGLCVNTVLTALGTAGLPYGREAFLLLGFGLGGFLLLSASCRTCARSSRPRAASACTSERSIPSTTPTSRS